MQKGVLLGAGAVLLAAAAFAGFRMLGNQEAGKEVDSTVAQIVGALPPGYAVTHGGTDVNPLTGRVTLHDLAVSYAGKPLWSADTATLTGVDQQALRDVFDPAAYPDGHPAAGAGRRLLIADATLEGWHAPKHVATDPDATIAALTLHGFSGRPFAVAPTPEAMKTSAFKADAALAFAIDSFEAHDIRVRDDRSKPTRVKIGAILLHGYDAGQAGKVALRRLSVDVAQGGVDGAALHVGLDHAELDDLDFRPPLKRAASESGLGLAGLAGAAYTTTDFGAFDVESTPGPKLHFDTITGHRAAPGADGTVAGEGTLTGFTLALRDTRLTAAQSQAVSAFGMTAIGMDLNASTRTNPVQGTIDVTEDFDFHDLCKLHLAATITGYHPPQGTEDAKTALLAASVTHAALELDDASLVNRIFAAVASQGGTTPDALRAQLAIPLMTAGLFVPDQPDIGEQLTRFLNHPGKLRITLDPPQKVTLADVAQAPAQSRAHLLGLHVEGK